MVVARGSSRSATRIPVRLIPWPPESHDAAAAPRRAAVATAGLVAKGQRGERVADVVDGVGEKGN